MPGTELATTEIIEIDPPNKLEKTGPAQAKPFLCRHIFTDGRRCGSPALRSENFCYYHQTHRTPVLARHRRQQRASGFELTMIDGLDNPAAIQLSIAQVLCRLADNTVDPKRAGLLLYGLQVAGNNLRRMPATDVAPVPDEIIEDATHGQLASLEPGRTEPETYISRMLSGQHPYEDPPTDD